MSSQPVRLEPGPHHSLRDLLFERGVEFPCGGMSRCGACKIRVREGNIPITRAMEEVLSPEELAAGWRLGCKAQGQEPVTLEIDQWSLSVLEDRYAVPFVPTPGLGIVLDVGTTTLVGQRVDRQTGEVLGVQTALSPQARFGADLMARIHRELEQPGLMAGLIRPALGSLVSQLTRSGPAAEILLVGNTAMHHFFCGVDIAPLAAVPFRSPSLEALCFCPEELGWAMARGARVEFLPCLGGFVGSDILAGVVATGLQRALSPSVLLDVGTNGEIVVGSQLGLQCASTAAGPAFEGGRIGKGMRAGLGAIDQVEVVRETLICHTIGDVEPKGICGSGLVDAVAGALDLGWLRPTGRLAEGREEIRLAGPVGLTKKDLRELQLAKGALAAGLRLLVGEETIGPGQFFLAGAFGNYLQAAKAQRIGLLPPWVASPVAAGNTALRGARFLLLAGPNRESLIQEVRDKMAHRELARHPQF